MDARQSLSIAGRLVLEGGVQPGRITVSDGLIHSVDLDDRVSGPYVAPGLVDIHVHGGAGYSVMDGPESLAQIARFLVGHGVTSFLPTSVCAPLQELVQFAMRIRDWLHEPTAAAAQPLGFNLEGPFLSPAKKGAQNPAHMLVPADVAWTRLAPLIEALRLITIAPELPGAPALIAELRRRSVAVSLGHSNADVTEANAGYAAGAAGTTHLFNAMSGVDHHRPGLAAVALSRDDVYVELVADGHHVDRTLWSTIWRAKPADRLILVSDAISLAGMPSGSSVLGGLDVQIADGRAVLAGSSTLAGSVLCLDDAIRNTVEEGLDIASAVQAATANPLRLIGVTDRGLLEPGLRADLVVFGDDLQVTDVMVGGSWVGP